MSQVSKLAAVMLMFLLGFTSHAAGAPRVVEQALASPEPAGCQPGGNVPSPGSGTTGSLPSGGIDRHYRVHLPPSYQSDRHLPVIIALHGRNATAEGMEQDSGLSNLDAIVVYPQALVAPDGKTAWEGAPYSPKVDDVTFINDLIDRLDADLCADAGRVYVVGLSNGGGLAAMLGCRLADRIAGYATVSGAFYPQAGECQPSRPVALVNFHGAADKVVPYAGNPEKGQPSVQDWLNERAALSRCRERAPLETPAPGIELDRWRGCRGAVAHYRIMDGGHEWPHRIDTPGLIWSFFTGAAD